MATNRNLITKVIAAFLPTGPVMRAAELRKVAEWQVAQRQLNWEEWLDIRDGWAGHYNALVATLPRDDDKGLQRAEEQAVREGRDYLLLEYV